MEFFTRSIDNSIYSRKALAATREAYRSYCTVQVKPYVDGKVDIAVEVKNGYSGQERQVILEFWNYFLDASCKQQLESA